MKKQCLVSVLFVCIVFWVFGDTEKQEEIDYLLFLPDSSSLFVNEAQAMVQLDNMAKYLRGRELSPGQIYVYGYAAFAENDIEPVNLSRDRALWVVNELQKRGVPYLLFADAVGHGSVDLWGNNEDEEGRSPNRRVRVVLDGTVITPQILKDAESEIPVATIDIEEDVEAPISQESTTDESKPFPWWILLLLPILGLIFFLLKKKKSPDKKTAKPEKIEEPIAAPVPAPIAASEPVKPTPIPIPASESVKPAATSTFTVNLEEEIRFRSYELYLRRYGHSENHYEDWCRAVLEISAKYEADGYQVYRENENWWARKVILS
jgi:hypothetical protein